MRTRTGTRKEESLAVSVGRALRRAGRTARKVARDHGTPVYVWREGKVVAQKP